jgi:CopG family transcriptional regulator, nickel-responsive regulator
MEVTVLKGKTSEVEHLAERIIAERGVRHERLATIPAEITVRTRPLTRASTHPSVLAAQCPK